MLKWLRWLDEILLGLVGLAAIVVSLLDYLGNISPDEQDYSLLLMILVGMVAVHLVLSSFDRKDVAHEQLSLLRQLASRVEGSNVTTFSSGQEVEEYLARRIPQAKVEVCDLSWKARIGPGFSASTRVRSHSAYEEAIRKVSRDLAYREIFIFNDARRIEKMQRRIAERQPGYSCRYFPNDSESPRLQFVIIDQDEVVLFATSPYSTLCAIRGPAVVGVFKPYFEEAWRAATPLKEGSVVYEENVRLASAGARADRAD